MAGYTLELPFGHFKQILGYLNERREACDDILCDVRLTVSNSCVVAHRCILAACSAYFQGMFSGAFMESRSAHIDSGMMEIDLSGAVSQLSDLQTLVSSLYTGCLPLSQDNIAGITQLACFLLVDDVQMLCHHYLHDTFSIHTCIRYIKLADKFSLHDLWEQASVMVCSRFHDHFTYCPEMWTISDTCLLRLSSSSLFQHVTRPVEVVQFLVHWLDGVKEGGDQEGDSVTGNSQGKYIEVAAKVLYDYLHRVKHHKTIGTQIMEISQTFLTGPPDIAEHLLNTVRDLCAQEDEVQSQLDPCVHTATQPVNNTGGCMHKGVKPVTDDSKKDGAESRASNLANFESHHKSSDHVPCVTIIPSDLENAGSGIDGSVSASTSTGSELETSMHNVLVAFVPGKETVAHVTAVECEPSRGRQSAVEFMVCVYQLETKQWLYIGQTTFPDVLEEKFSWKVACLHPKVYFLSLKRRALHVFDLSFQQWSMVDCTPACQALSCEISSLVPVAVGGKLYVLASDKVKKRDDGTLYETQQRYLCLKPDGQWEPIADVHHCHMATPLSILSVSDSKVYVVKASITLPSYNNQKSLLLIREGHVFDSQTGEISKFEGKTFAPSPMRLLVRDEHLVVVDGEGWCRQLNSDGQDWTSRNLDLSDIRWCRAASDESHYPCLTNVSAAMGPSVWEFSGFHDHNSALLELRLTADGNVVTENHPPPPFRYITVITAGELGEKLLSSLPPCHYVHA